MVFIGKIFFSKSSVYLKIIDYENRISNQLKNGKSLLPHPFYLKKRSGILKLPKYLVYRTLEADKNAMQLKHNLT